MPETTGFWGRGWSPRTAGVCLREESVTAAFIDEGPEGAEEREAGAELFFSPEELLVGDAFANEGFASREPAGMDLLLLVASFGGPSRRGPLTRFSPVALNVRLERVPLTVISALMGIHLVLSAANRRVHKRQNQLPSILRSLPTRFKVAKTYSSSSRQSHPTQQHPVCLPRWRPCSSSPRASPTPRSGKASSRDLLPRRALDQRP